eukprot:COSAG04_NODE_738_length_10699_cov_72.861604_4_plen_35_part_00
MPGAVFFYHWGWSLLGEQLSVQINLAGLGAAPLA